LIRKKKIKRSAKNLKTWAKKQKIEKERMKYRPKKDDGGRKKKKKKLLLREGGCLHTFRAGETGLRAEVAGPLNVCTRGETLEEQGISPIQNTTVIGTKRRKYNVVPERKWHRPRKKGGGAITWASEKGDKSLAERECMQEAERGRDRVLFDC